MTDEREPQNSPQADAFTEHYRSLERKELVRQGADHLRGDLRVRMQRTRHLLRVIMVTLVAGIGCGMAAMLLYILFQAKQSGESLAALRQAAIEAYTGPDSE